MEQARIILISGPVPLKFRVFRPRGGGIVPRATALTRLESPRSPTPMASEAPCTSIESGSPLGASHRTPPAAGSLRFLPPLEERLLRYQRIADDMPIQRPTRSRETDMADFVFGRHARSSWREMHEIANDCRTLLDKRGVVAPTPPSALRCNRRLASPALKQPGPVQVGQ